MLKGVRYDKEHELLIRNSKEDKPYNSDQFITVMTITVMPNLFRHLMLSYKESSIIKAVC